MKEPINIFWFKRDLRLLDNEPLNNAVSQKEKLILIYCFEPSLKKNKHYSTKHWNFIKESINDLNTDYKIFTTQFDEITKAGFVLDVDSNILEHPEDTRDYSFVRDQQTNRDQTDRMVLKFVKPIKVG